MTGDPAARRAKLQAMDDAFVLCRALGHAWSLELLTYAVVGGVEHRGYRTEVKRCDRCTTEARTVWDGQLFVTESTWSYAPGYLLPAGAEAHYRHEAMAELWDRAEVRDKPKGKRRRQASHPAGTSRRSTA